MLFRSLFIGVGTSAVPALMPLVARDLVGGGPLTFGLLLGGFGFGAILGALSSIRLRARFRPEAIVRIALLAQAIGTLAVALSQILPVTILGTMLAGSGWVLALSTSNVSIQLATPRWVVARAIALFQMAAFGGMAAGSWVYGLTAETYGISIALLTALVPHSISLVLGFILPLPDIQGTNLDPRGWEAPETVLHVEPRSGPIVTTIEYRIAEADIDRFLVAMNERRRIRRRDGARHWTLLRDLMDTEVWIERYHVATWLDYVRHNQRRTYADADNSREILALHRGENPPVVKRRIEWQTRGLAAEKDGITGVISEPLSDGSASP